MYNALALIYVEKFLFDAVMKQKYTSTIGSESRQEAKFKLKLIFVSVN